ncbi:TonB-dependent receptor [Flaviaesturariibacter amylovorans]|uniref:TonB-dependent receptor n=1 Tax=Flaviaesturariibacter amylovorans TaxID=1084520 RepID=A0ABP8HSD2_9BACT
MFAQNTLTVKGRITDDAAQPLAGVSVVEKGSANGTTTNAAGTYTLRVSNGAALLQISYTGFETREQPVNNQALLNVSLTPDNKSLAQVVVVGYGTQRRASVTGSIASVKATELMQTPVTNVAQGLQSRVAGVQINQNSSAPGGNISVRIRGTNSINGTSEPLYVIDGVQIGNGGGVNDISPLSTINPGDIESVEVLKDASSTAIYGARGANGVVLITTKRGRAGGGTRVSYESYYGQQEATRKIDMLNSVEFAKLENEVYRSNIYPDPASLGNGVNWQDLVLRKAAISSHQLMVNGGNEKTQFYFSGNYFDQKGVILSSDFKRYSLRMNLDHQISERFKMGTSLFGSYTINNRIPTGFSSIDGGATNSIVGAAIVAPPVLAPYNPDGMIFPFADQLNGRYREVVNPLGLAEITDRNATVRSIVNVYGEAKILKGLSYRASFNVDLNDGANDYYSPIYIVAVRDRNANTGSAAKFNDRGITLLHESILTYTTEIARDHTFKFTGVFATQSNSLESSNASAFGFPNDATLYNALQLAPQANRSASSFRSRDRLDSYMGRLNYGFRNRYFLDVTARYDGSSKFGESNKYGFFPAFSAAWRVSEENFMANQKLFSDLKFRVSYGSTGNAGAIAPYQSLALFNPTGGYNFNNGAPAVGIAPARVPNPDLRWERSVQADIGLDASFFNNRLNIVVDLYNKRTKDLLFVRQLPFSSGYASLTGNFAEIENRGVEFAADARLINSESIKWTVNGNITFNRNKLISLVDNREESVVNNYSVLQVGQPLGIFKTFVFDGIYQTGETVLPGSDSRTGGVKVRDLNKDGQITAADQIITGNANPKFIYGFSTNFRFRNFDLSALFAGVQGNKVYNLLRYTLENPLGNRNVVAGMVDRWSPTNPNNEFASGFQGGRLPISDRFMEDGSFLRCKNLTLGYRLPAIKGISSARVYLSANNLFTITNYTGYDPEVNTFGNSNVLLGVDNGVYPMARSIIGGLQVNF